MSPATCCAYAAATQAKKATKHVACFTGCIGLVYTAKGEGNMTRTRVAVLAGACVLATVAIAAAPAEQGAVRIVKDPQGYWFTEGDTRVLFYQAERKALPDGRAARSNYFHPLYDLDGNVLTED